MTRRYLSGWLALISLAALSGCGVTETPEQCVERFERLMAAGPPGFREARFQPIFTYDVSQMENVLEQLVGKGADRAGVRMTLAHGASGPALDRFHKAEVPRKGHIFAADGFTLFSLPGQPGARAETLEAGCRGAPPKARLVRVRWVPAAEGNAQASVSVI